MKADLFAYTDYKKYLTDWIDLRATQGRGKRSEIAVALKCNAAYVSRVLNGEAQFSLEQAHALNSYLGHTEEEADFFLLLVLYARAGTKTLADYYLAKIRAAIERRGVLKNRLEYRKSLPEVEQATYFSAWYYAAVHLLLSLPKVQTKEAMARFLKLSEKQIAGVLEFLLKAGLAEEKRGRYVTGAVSLHLGNDSPMISKHHTNWRLQALQALERANAGELHYSSVVTVGAKDVPRIREILVSAIEQVRSIVKNTEAEEVMYCYLLDLFEVGAPG